MFKVISIFTFINSLRDVFKMFETFQVFLKLQLHNDRGTLSENHSSII